MWTFWHRELGNWRTSSRSGPAYQGLADGDPDADHRRATSGRWPDCPASGRSPTRCGCRARRSPPRTAQLREDGYFNARRGARSTTALPVPRQRARCRIDHRQPGRGGTVCACHRGDGGVHRGGQQLTPFLPSRATNSSASRRCGRRSPKDIASEDFPRSPTKSWSPPERCTPSCLILATYTQPGDRVLVEQPTYHGALSAITTTGARPVPVA